MPSNVRWAGRFFVFWAAFLFIGYGWVWIIEFVHQLASMDALLRFGIISATGAVIAAFFTMHVFGGKDDAV